jgi:hypothetical protein
MAKAKRGPGQPKKEPTKVISIRGKVKDYEDVEKDKGIKPEAIMKQKWEALVKSVNKKK